jgi:hypothetical protein
MSRRSGEIRIPARVLRVIFAAGTGVILIAVPTLFAIFPGWTQWPVDDRTRVFVGWIFIAVVGAGLTAFADERLHAGIEADQRAAIRAEHRATLRDHFRSILVPGIGGLPPQYHLTVFAPTKDKKFLIPVYPPALGFTDPAIFPVGAGAVGKAWEEHSGVYVVTGSAVSTGDHGLTAVQQRRYKMFDTVAAAAITDDHGAPIGVLGAIGRDESGFFDQESGVELLKDLAQGVAWLIQASVQWMMPEEDDGE